MALIERRVGPFESRFCKGNACLGFFFAFLSYIAFITAGRGARCKVQRYVIFVFMVFWNAALLDFFLSRCLSIIPDATRAPFAMRKYPILPEPHPYHSSNFMMQNLLPELDRSGRASGPMPAQLRRHLS